MSRTNFIVCSVMILLLKLNAQASPELTVKGAGYLKSSKKSAAFEFNIKMNNTSPTGYFFLKEGNKEGTKFDKDLAYNIRNFDSMVVIGKEAVIQAQTTIRNKPAELRIIIKDLKTPGTLDPIVDELEIKLIVGNRELSLIKGNIKPGDIAISEAGQTRSVIFACAEPAITSSYCGILFTELYMANDNELHEIINVGDFQHHLKWLQIPGDEKTIILTQINEITLKQNQAIVKAAVNFKGKPAMATVEFIDNKLPCDVEKTLEDTYHITVMVGNKKVYELGPVSAGDSITIIE